MDKTASSFVAIAFIIAFFLVGVYDIFALASQGKIPTITENVQNWSRDFPILPFFCGVVIGHLFFPSK